MTTPQPAALPELPEPRKAKEFGYNGDVFSADQMRAYALAALQSQPAAEAALQKFVRLKVADEVRSPLEQLRSFCSFAMSGQDWIDCEPFFDAIVESAQPAAAGVSDDELRQAVDALRDPNTVSAFYNGYYTLKPDELRRAILALRPQSAIVGRTIGDGSGQAVIYDTTLPDSTPLYADALRPQSDHPDTARCVKARNDLNAALHGDGALIDDLEHAVANACARLKRRRSFADERAAFESWMSEGGKWPKAVERSHNGDYLLLQTATNWATWQACASLRPQAVPMTDAWSWLTEANIDAYLEGYEMRGEDEGGRDACYTPTEGDRALLKDFVMGLLTEAQEAAHHGIAAQGAQGREG